MAQKYDESDGVWRTIGGRRVFIKNGQSLSDAMKESGKFSRVKRNEQLYKKLDEEKNNTKNMLDLEMSKYTSKEKLERAKEKLESDKLTAEEREYYENYVEKREGKSIKDILQETNAQTSREEEIKAKAKEKDKDELPEKKKLMGYRINEETGKRELYEHTEQDDELGHWEKDKNGDRVFVKNPRYKETSNDKDTIDKFDLTGNELEDFKNELKYNRGVSRKNGMDESVDLDYVIDRLENDVKVDKDDEFLKELKHNQKINKEKGLENRVDMGYVVDRLNDSGSKHEKTSSEQFEVSDLKKKAQEVLPKEDIDTHEGDLYLKKTSKSEELIKNMKNADSDMISTFRDQQTGEIWYDIPFANWKDDYKEKTKELSSNSGQEKISNNVKVMRYGDDYVVLKNGHNEKEFKNQSDAESYAKTLTNNDTMNDAIREKVNNRKVSYQKGYSKGGNVTSQNVKIGSQERDNINEAIRKEIEAGYPNYKDYANDKVSARMYLEELGNGDYKDTNNTTNRFVKNFLGEDKIKSDRNTRYLIDNKSSKVKKIPRNLSKDIYELDVDKGNAWSGDATTKNARGDEFVRVRRNGPSQNSSQDIKDAIEKKYPHLEGKIVGDNEVDFSVRKNNSQTNGDKTMNDKIRDEAYRNYMKNHPNSKMTLDEFLKKKK